jgi:hypothetical protein
MLRGAQLISLNELRNRGVRAVLLALGPNVDHHVDAVAGSQHLNLVRGVAGIRDSIDARAPGDRRQLARSQGRGAALGVILHQVLEIGPVGILRPLTLFQLDDADQIGDRPGLDQEVGLRRVACPDAARGDRRRLRQRNREAIGIRAELAPLSLGEGQPALECEQRESNQQTAHADPFRHEKRPTQSVISAATPPPVARDMRTKTHKQSADVRFASALIITARDCGTSAAFAILSAALIP